MYHNGALRLWYTNCHTEKHTTAKEETALALPAKKERDRYTYADVLEWDESERAEIIGGRCF